MSCAAADGVLVGETAGMNLDFNNLTDIRKGSVNIVKGLGGSVLLYRL